MLSQVVVEVRFKRGVVYLDRCGSLTLRIQDALGPPFEASLPSMQGAQLTNGPERLVVGYGTDAFSVTQAWMANPVRVELIAPPTWEEVATVLSVGDQVTRVGARFVVALSVPDVATGEKRIVDSGICPGPPWGGGLGHATGGTWTFAATTAGGGKVRAGLAATPITVKGGVLPADLASVIPQAAILLDFDHVLFEVDEPQKLSRAQLKDFVRASWQATKKSATPMRRELGL